MTHTPDSPLFTLLRLAFGTQAQDVDLTQVTDAQWREVVELSFAHGLGAVVAEGYQEWLDQHPAAKPRLEADDMWNERLRLLGTVLKVETFSRKYDENLDELCTFLHESGLTPMLLKGRDAASNYPHPSLRPPGDIDLCFIGTDSAAKADKADKLMSAHFGGKYVHERDARHGKYNFKGIPVENHYHFAHSGRWLSGRERRFERVLTEFSVRGCVDHGTYLTPCPTFNALFLMHHLSGHLLYEYVNLRQMCDYLCFLLRHGAEVDWVLVNRELEAAGLRPFADAVHTVLVRWFALESSLIPGFTADDATANRLMECILRNERRTFKHLDNILRYPRNAWKFRLVTGHGWLLPLLKNALQHIKFLIYFRNI